MENNNKRISILVMLSSVLILIYSFIIKDFDPFVNEEVYYLVQNHLEVPLNYYYVNFLGIHIPYKSIIFIALLFLAIGIYLYMYKNDDYIIKTYNGIKEKALTKKNKIVDTNQPKKEMNSESKLIITYVIISLVILLLIGLFSYYSNYIKEQALTRPLSAFESFYQGYLGTLVKLIVFGVIIKSVLNLFKGK